MKHLISKDKDSLKTNKEGSTLLEFSTPWLRLETDFSCETQNAMLGLRLENSDTKGLRIWRPTLAIVSFKCANKIATLVTKIRVLYKNSPNDEIQEEF
jgi:hypothetical protein